MNDSHVSGRYAKALFLLTEKLAAKDGRPLVGVLERTLEDLRSVAELVRPGSRLGGFLANPQVSPNDKRRILESGLKDRALRSVAVFTDLLLRKKRLGFADEIATQFHRLVEKAQGLQRAQVVSAVPLERDEVRRLHGELERTTGRKVVLSESVDPSLVGGAYVRIGDRVIDRSVKTLLETISQQLFDVSV
jgi:F-type H+-transporting ATPase subunit delta